MIKRTTALLGVDASMEPRAPVRCSAKGESTLIGFFYISTVFDGSSLLLFLIYDKRPFAPRLSIEQDGACLIEVEYFLVPRCCPSFLARYPVRSKLASGDYSLERVWTLHIRQSNRAHDPWFVLVLSQERKSDTFKSGRVYLAIESGHPRFLIGVYEPVIIGTRFVGSTVFKFQSYVARSQVYRLANRPPPWVTINLAAREPLSELIPMRSAQTELILLVSNYNISVYPLTQRISFQVRINYTTIIVCRPLRP
ncbi:hypothetical protein BDR07DRAFT_1456850 [Suillus spraguei]|nr:hypothetical protein BDR07DRAFT_1456850 [Suillus spraguei]